jgi:predicted amidohydrolase
MQQRPARITLAAAAYPVEELATFAAFRDKAAGWVERAAREGAELLVLPEYGGMELARVAGREAALDVPRSLRAAAELGEQAQAVWGGLAVRHRAHIIAPSGPEAGADGKLRNVARIYAPNGRVGQQAKMILTPWERDWGLAPGRRPCVLETSLGRIAVPICYDSEFPLLLRACVEAGAEIIAIPACTDALTGYSRVRTAALARALESQAVCALAPLVGTADWCPAIDRNVGAAGLYVPADRGVSDTGVLSEGRLGEPGWVIATIELEPIRALRTGGEVRTYAHWGEQPGAPPLADAVQVVSLL